MIPLYRNDPYLAAHETIIDNISADGESQLLSFRESLFTQGGGQPRDHGTIIASGHRRVVEELVKHKGDIRIRIAAIPDLAKGMPVRCELDFERRFRIMRLHTAQHAIAGALRGMSDGYETAGMQIAEDVASCRMKFCCASECGETEIERAFAVVGEKERVVRAETHESAAAAESAYGSLYRPSDPSVVLKGKVRVIVIDGLDVNACGGTHVRNTNEIAGLRLVALDDGPNERALTFALA